MGGTGKDGVDSVLKRKLGAAGGGIATGPHADAASIWQQVLARAAHDTARLQVGIATSGDHRRSLAELLEVLPDNALLAVLEGPQDSCGLIALSHGMFAALIEALTTGRITDRAPSPRRPTRTDAALAAPLIDRALGLLEVGLTAAPDFTWASGFRYASHIDEARVLALLLDDVPYRVLKLGLDIAGGARGGEIVLALPAAGRVEAPAPVRDRNHREQEAWQQSLGAAIGMAEVTLTAVIGRQRLPLRDLLAMAPGTILALERASIDQVRIETGDGSLVTTGRLGQHRGVRALKLQAAVKPAASPVEFPSITAATAVENSTSSDLAQTNLAMPDIALPDPAIPDPTSADSTESEVDLDADALPGLATFTWPDPDESPAAQSA